jgi:hypothetical protein
VNLADRRRGERLPVELGERVLNRPPELAPEHVLSQLRRHRRRVAPQPSQCRLVGGLKLLADYGAERDERQHLAGLHQRALGGAEQLGVALGGTDVKLGAVRAGQLASQPDDDRLARGASAEGRQRDGAPQPSAADAVIHGVSLSRSSGLNPRLLT